MRLPTLAAALILWGGLARAAVEPGAAFLRVGSGARPAALGNAFTAVADDVDALYYNPGGLSRLEHPELGATHAEWLLDTRFDFLGYAHPSRFGTIGLGLARLTAGSQEGRGADRGRTGGFTAADTAFTLSYGRNDLLGAGTGVGLSAKFIESRIGSDSASTLAFDIGVLKPLLGSRLSMGAAVLNLGRGLRFIDQVDPLPLTLAVGTAYHFGGLLRVAFDVRHETPTRRTEFGIGSEYSIVRGLSLRAGYASPAAARSGIGGESRLNGIGGGFGLRFGRYRADYTFTPFGALGSLHRTSLGTRF